MKLHTLKTAVLALVGLALVASSAKAATLNYNDGDLFIGFVNGGTQDYLIDVGQATQFFGVSGTITLSGLGGTATDLNSTFGGSWFGSASVKWGAAGTTDFGTDSSNSGNTVWATRTSTTPWTDSGNQSSPNSSIDTIANGDFVGNASTANSSVAMVQTASNGASWASFESVANGGTGANSTSGSIGAYFQPSIEGLTNQKLYLTQLTEGDTNPGQSLGYFQINSGGTITFTNAVPEPSTYALMILGGAALLFVTKFGRRSDIV